VEDAVPDVRDLWRGEVVAEPLVLVARVPLAVADVFGRQLPPPARRGLVERGGEERLVVGIDIPILIKVRAEVPRAVVGVERRLIVLVDLAALVVVARCE
jgi:hypothetical protein